MPQSAPKVALDMLGSALSSVFTYSRRWLAVGGVLRRRRFSLIRRAAFWSLVSPDSSMAVFRQSIFNSSHSLTRRRPSITLSESSMTTGTFRPLALMSSRRASTSVWYGKEDGR